MSIVKHEFTKIIIKIIDNYFPNQGNSILNASELLQYLNIKTRAANRGSKSRAGLANHYAIYVLVEDYINNEFHLKDGYDEYQGAQYMTLFRRQRELPFGNKLQNHALNHRLNQEFNKYFPTLSYHIKYVPERLLGACRSIDKFQVSHQNNNLTVFLSFSKLIGIFT